jgi:hypothetical protein
MTRRASEIIRVRRGRAREKDESPGPPVKRSDGAAAYVPEDEFTHEGGGGIDGQGLQSSLVVSPARRRRMEILEHDEPPCSEEGFGWIERRETTEVAAPRWGVGDRPPEPREAEHRSPTRRTSRTPGRTENPMPPTGGGTGGVRMSYLSG